MFSRKSWIARVALLVVCLSLTGCPKKLAADFSASAQSGTAPLRVQFTDTSTPGDTPITAWHWLFGDGSESVEQNPSHVYSLVGNYNVSLEVTASTGTDTSLKLSLIHATAPVAGEVQTVMLPGNVPLEMVWIAAGTFSMGSPDTEPGRDAGEGPVHLVALGGYWMGKNLVTQAQWKAVAGGSNPSFFQSGQNGVPADANTDNCPVEQVSWNDLQAFIIALNTATGDTFRLPSEAEWEYACRAGNHVPPTRFYWGDDLAYVDIGNYAWYAGNSGAQTHDVGGKTANAFGLYDMAGNVWEWVQDWWHNNYVGAPPDGSAWEAPAGAARVVRGGAWNKTEHNLRSASRSGNDPSSAYSLIGFRLAR